MSAPDWAQCSAVESVPGMVSGAWVFKGTRTPVATIFENLADGMTIGELLRQFPVTHEQVKRSSNLRLGVWTHPVPGAERSQSGAST
jgi:uncharacterized protein (DUF433 family)